MNSAFGLVVSGLLTITSTVAPVDVGEIGVGPQGAPNSYQSARELTHDEIEEAAKRSGIENVEIIPRQSFTGVDIQGENDISNIETRWLQTFACQATPGFTNTCSDHIAHISNSFELRYSWWAQTSSNANVTGRGYEWGKETWRGGGNGKHGSFVVPWYTSGGNGSKVSVAANKTVRVRSMSAPLGIYMIVQ